MILVTGATGNIGSEVLRRALASSEDVRILSRDPSKLASVKGRAETVKADLTQPQTLPDAFKGIERAFIVVEAADALPQVSKGIFDAAKASGVRHVVFISSNTVMFEPSVAIGRWHLAAEESLKASGIAWTMVRPGNFSSNALRWAGSLKAQGTVFAPGGDGKSAPVHPSDIGAVAATALLNKGHQGKTYVVTGPELLSPKEQVQVIANVVGKPFRFVDIPADKAREQMLKHMPPMMADGVLELILAPRTGAVVSVASTVKAVTGTDARTFETWVRENARAFS